MQKLGIFFVSILFAGLPLSAQVSAPSADVQQRTAPQGAPVAPVAANTAWLTNLEQTAMKTVTDLGDLRVNKWKTDGRSKDQASDNIESLQRNLSDALPVLIQGVRANPTSVAPNFRLYHNLNAVYDVLSSVTESAGAFGSKVEYNTLAQDTAGLDLIRHNLADQLEQMTSSQDALVSGLSAQLRAQQENAAEAPPKRVIIDDESPKKVVKSKKKPAAKVEHPK